MNTPSIPLSCYIRTLNEAATISRVVKSVREIGAETIVIDCGSTDGTQEIAEQLGARVIHQEWLGNGHQKKIGEQAATYDWLLDLDADEILSESLQNEIINLFLNGEPKPSLYSLKLVTIPPIPPHKPWETSCLAWRNKLYHKSILSMPAHAAWDQLNVPRSITPVRLQGSLYHQSFKNIEAMVSKMNRVSSVRATETVLKNRSLLIVRILFAFPFYFGKKYFRQSMYRTGIYGFACAIIMASNRWLKDVKMYERFLKER